MGSWELDLPSGKIVWSEQMCRILGLPPDTPGADADALTGLVHADDRERIAGLLALVTERPEVASDEGLMADFRIVQPDGSVRELRSHARVARDDDGRPVRLVGVAQDLTAQRMSERELAAHHAVGEVLREWDSLRLGVVDLLRRIGEALDYPMASMWLWDDDTERLVCRAFWNAPGVNAAYFQDIKRGLTFNPGEGKPGRAWSPGNR